MCAVYTLAKSCNCTCINYRCHPPYIVMCTTFNVAYTVILYIATPLGWYFFYYITGNIDNLNLFYSKNFLSIWSCHHGSYVQLSYQSRVVAIFLLGWSAARRRCISIHKHAWIPAMVIIYLWEKRTNPSNSWEVKPVNVYTYIYTLTDCVCVYIYTHYTCNVSAYRLSADTHTHTQNNNK